MTIALTPCFDHSGSDDSFDQSDVSEPAQPSDMSDTDEDQPLEEDTLAATFYKVLPHLRKQRSLISLCLPLIYCCRRRA